MAVKYDQPDRGYAWVILCLCFMVQFMISCSYASLGLLLVEYLEYFQQDKTATSWIGATMLACAGIMGIFVGPLVERFGHRRVTQLGAILVFLGYVLSSLAPNIYVLYVTHGLTVGTGFSCWLVDVSVVLQEFFNKKRGLAMAISTVGLGCGVLFWSYFTGYFIAEYTYKGCLLLLGALNLHGLVVAALLRSPRFSPITNRQSCTENTSQEETWIHLKSGPVMSPKSGMDASTGSQSKQDSSGNEHIDLLEPCAVPADGNGSLHKISLDGRNWKQNDILDHTRHYGEQITNHGNGFDIHSNIDGRDTDIQTPRLDYSNKSLTDKGKHLLHADIAPLTVEDGDTPASDEVCESVSLRTKGEIEASYPLVNSDMHKNNGSLGAAPAMKASQPTRSNGRHKKDRMPVLAGLLSILDFTVLKDATVAFYFVAVFLVNFGDLLPYSFVPLRVINTGASKAQAAFLVTVMGIGSCVGRIFFGWAGDRPWANRKLMYGVSGLIAGLLSAISYAFDQYYMLVTYCMLFALLSSSYISIQFTVMGDIVCMDRLAQAIGLLVFFMGISMLLATSLSGFLIDMSGDPAFAFLVMGLVQAIGGIMGLLGYWSGELKKTQNSKDDDTVNA